jgi:hypothetical protein
MDQQLQHSAATHEKPLTAKSALVPNPEKTIFDVARWSMSNLINMHPDKPGEGRWVRWDEFRRPRKQGNS